MTGGNRSEERARNTKQCGVCGHSEGRSRGSAYGTRKRRGGSEKSNQKKVALKRRMISNKRFSEDQTKRLFSCHYIDHHESLRLCVRHPLPLLEIKPSLRGRFLRSCLCEPCADICIHLGCTWKTKLPLCRLC
jgi:hypothetical protein